MQAYSLRDQPFNAFEGGAKVLAAIKEVLDCGGPIEVALKHGEAALLDLRERLPEPPSDTLSDE